MADTSLSYEKIGLLVWQVSNYWQNTMRNSLKEFNLTLNEYLILQSLSNINIPSDEISQKKISSFSGIDISVVSVVLKLLENKGYVNRSFDKDNRKKTVEMLARGKNIYKVVYPKLQSIEHDIFVKLQSESINFTNSLKLILGKKVRIKATKN